MGRSSLSRFAIERAMQQRTGGVVAPTVHTQQDGGHSVTHSRSASGQSRQSERRARERGVAPQHRGAGQIRIVGGQWRRRLVPVLSGQDMPSGLRPTPDRVRETLFNWLGQDLTGWRGLDVCAGTGVLGLEAASRGAAHVVLVEQHALLAQHLQQLVRDWQATAAVEVRHGDGLQVLRTLAHNQPTTLDVIWLDPPFDAQWYADALHAARSAIKPNGWLYLEAARAYTPNVLADCGWRLHRSLKAGMVHAHLLAPISAGEM